MFDQPLNTAGAKCARGAPELRIEKFKHSDISNK
jgi:hypothetical protein